MREGIEEALLRILSNMFDKHNMSKEYARLILDNLTEEIKKRGNWKFKEGYNDAIEDVLNARGFNSKLLTEYTKARIDEVKNDAEIGFDAGWNEACQFVGATIHAREKMSRRGKFLVRLQRQDLNKNIHFNLTKQKE